MAMRAALLRGINVGRHRRIGMVQLRAVLEGAGYTGVKTLLQSGNIVFQERELDAEECAHNLEQVIRDAFDLSVQVMIRDGRDLQEIVDGNPLGELAQDFSRYVVAFLSAAPTLERGKALAAMDFFPDVLRISGREVYIWCPNGYSETKITPALLERRLAVASTVRNWNTVLHLRELLEA